MASDEPASDDEVFYEEPEVEPELSLGLVPDLSMEAEEPSATPAMRWRGWDPEASDTELAEPARDSTVDSKGLEVYSEDDLFHWPSDAVTSEDEEDSSSSLDSTGLWPIARPVEPPG